MVHPVERDPNHPHAGSGGIVPPMATRFKKGEHRTGRPKGACPRAAAARELARNPDADGIGEIANEIGIALVEAARQGDLQRCKALGELINQVEGKPKEFVEHSGGQTVVRLTFTDVPDEVADELVNEDDE